MAEGRSWLPARQEGLVPDRVDAVIASRFPTSAERRWATIPWREPADTAIEEARSRGVPILLAIVDGALATEAIALGRNGLWRSPLTDGGLPEILGRGWIAMLLARADVARCFGAAAPIRSAIARLPSENRTCGIVGYVACGPDAKPLGVLAHRDASVARFRALLDGRTARRTTVGARPAQGRTLEGIDEVLRLNVALRRLENPTTEAFVPGFPVEARSVGFSMEDALALGPPTAHGESGQRWHLPRSVVDRLWCAFSPSPRVGIDPSAVDDASIGAEVAWSGRGCRVAYRGAWRGRARGTGPALEVVVEGYALFGADRMPRVVRFATNRAEWGGRWVGGALREA